MGWTQIFPVFLHNADFLLFAVYGAAAVRIMSLRPAPAIVRFLWFCLLAVAIVSAIRAWGGAFVLPAPTTEASRIIRFAFDVALKGLTLGAALLLGARSWRLASAPTLASAVAIVAALALWWLGGSWETWGVWVGFLTGWHLACASFLYVVLRITRRQRRGMEATVCCSVCGYPLTGLASPEQCPECGARFAASA